MNPYIFGVRNKIHIIDLQHTIKLLKPALNYLKLVAQRNNKILFVGTKLAVKNEIKKNLNAKEVDANGLKCYSSANEVPVLFYNLTFLNNYSGF